MKAASALAFLNLSAVQRTLHHASRHVLYLDILLVPCLLARIRLHFITLGARVTDEKKKKKEKKELVRTLFPNAVEEIILINSSSHACVATPAK